MPYESKMTDADVYTGTLLGIAEMINNGVTVFADHYFGEEQVLKAVKETGIRADLAPTVFGASSDFKERLAQVSEFIETHRNESGRVAFHMGPMTIIPVREKPRADCGRGETPCAHSPSRI